MLRGVQTILIRESVSLGNSKSFVRYTSDTFELIELAALHVKLYMNQICKFLFYATSANIESVYLRSGSVSCSSDSLSSISEPVSSGNSKTFLFVPWWRGLRDTCSTFFFFFFLFFFLNELERLMGDEGWLSPSAPFFYFAISSEASSPSETAVESTSGTKNAM